MTLLLLVGCLKYEGPGQDEADTDVDTDADADADADVDTDTDADTDTVPPGQPGLSAPASIDLGQVFIPCEATSTVTLSSIGDQPVTIDAVGTSGAGFGYEGLVVPATLASGSTISLQVAYTAEAPGAASGTLDIDSDDPRGRRTVALTAQPAYVDTVVQADQVPTSAPVDILFAVDQSCSMDALSQNGGYGALAAGLGGDWRIGVTDVVDGCLHQPVLEPSTPNVGASLASQVLIGTDSSGEDTLSERLTQLVALTLDQTGPGDCNEGFLRPGAALHIVLVSDEPDFSPNTWSTYLADYETYASDVTVSALVDHTNGSTGACGFGGAGTYPAIVAATGGILGNICANQPALQLQGISEGASVGAITLEDTAHEPSLEVLVDGQPVGFTLDGDLLTFDTPIQPGQSYEVTYGVPAQCP